MKSVRWNLTEHKDTLKEDLKIYILANNKILCFVLNITRLLIQNFDSTISIRRIARGRIIDW